MTGVLILGGYGNFGKRIACALVKERIPVIIAGRNAAKARTLVAELGPLAQAAAFDVHSELANQLALLKPRVLIHTIGPFQNADYHVAETCIAAGVHYIDIADARDFVTGISALNERALRAGICVVSGASTVPGLSSAVIEHFRDEFARIDSLRFGISPGQRAERGLATTKAILTYVGRPLRPVPGDMQRRYGWQDLYLQRYPELGRRWMANCDIPDLDLLPERYGIGRIRFSAGMENPLIHLGMWALGWLVRLGLPLDLPAHAAFLLSASHWFDPFGSADGGMHMILTGMGRDGRPRQRRWFIIAKNGDGPQIPCVPAIVLAKKWMGGVLPEAGSGACLGLVPLEAYLAVLQSFAVTTFTDE